MTETWHPETLSANAARTMELLARQEVIASFYLAGGTALALQWGHRISVDLDFFNDAVDETVLLGALSKEIANIKVVSQAAQTLHLEIDSTKVSFIGYPYPVLFPLKTYAGLKVADSRDIAAMKLSALASRGSKRDFIDLYVLAQQYGLDEIFRLFARKFSHLSFNDIHLLKALSYFSDADQQPDPHMLQPIEWSAVKRFFLTRVPRLRK
jgi:predicted nucleotidyltransferase component of viral defense system